MIKLTDARLTDALPKTLAEQPWVQALAEASRKMRRRVMAYADRTRLFCDIDEASEEALDALAVELQTPLYKNDYPLTVKRQIVKNSMLYYIRSGTRGAVEELLADIYQGAEVEEWFEYGGEPNYFRVAIDISRTTVPVAEMTPAELESWLYSVKRASSALESLSYMIRHAITIGCKVEAFLQSPPECGTLECGTYPEASTLGWSAGAWLQIAGRADAYLVSPPECGTVPEISTVGWSIDAAISQAGSVAEAFVIEPPEAGTAEAGEKPLTATLGQSLEAGSQYTAKVDIYLVTPPESGATECGAGI
ncbi:MAG: phage tail protein [Gemmiger formicilis]|uniref:phage tail protein n=1 Tax=Gemmiger formicilis TaxID=745368 RepID=UPI0039942232